MEGHIFIYGEITPYEGDDVNYYGAVNLKDVSNQLTNNREADTLIVHINSMGGDVYEGFAIHDVLKATGKKIITQAEGLVASIASVIFMAGDTRRMLENSELMIHNPWGVAIGDSEDVQKYADQLKDVEDKLIKFYASGTGLSEDDITAMMEEETYINAETAVEKGFATEIAAQVKAVAKLNFKNKMTHEELSVKVEESTNTLLSKIMGLFSKAGMIKNYVLKTADDKDIDFGDAVKDEADIMPGVEAKVDGKAATGDFLMPDGKTFVFAEGKLSEIKEKQAESDEVSNLKAENETLKAQLDEFKASLETLKTEVESYKEVLTSDISGFKNEHRDETIVRKPFKK